MNNRLFNKPDKIDRKCNEIIKNTLAQKPDPIKKLLQLYRILHNQRRINLFYMINI
jgi:hypothetical protein